MSPALFTHLFTRPALLLAASLVLLGAATGHAAPAGGPEKAGEQPASRDARQSLDVLCRTLGASLSSERDVGVGYAVFPAPAAAFGIGQPGISKAVEQRACDHAGGPRLRLRRCPVGPAPPVEH